VTYSKDNLEDIMTDAKLGFSLSEIALRLGITEQELFLDYQNDKTQVKLFYDAGRSLGKIETDRPLFNLAKNGSATAKQAYDLKLKEANLTNEIAQIFEV